VWVLVAGVEGEEQEPDQNLEKSKSKMIIWEVRMRCVRFVIRGKGWGM
jgi:hypothetical protein